MFYGAKNGTVDINGSPMDYARFGRGEETLVILPGLSDGLRTVRGRACRLALSYRAYAAGATSPRDTPPGTWRGIRPRPCARSASARRTCWASPRAA